jgi:hypothetical protein
MHSDYLLMRNALCVRVSELFASRSWLRVAPGVNARMSAPPVLITRALVLRSGEVARRRSFLFLLVAFWIIAFLQFGHSERAHAFLPPGDGDGGGGGGGTPVGNCLANTVTNINATPTTIDPGRPATISWSIQPPTGCTLFNRVIVNGQNFGLTGSIVVQPLATTDYPLTLVLPGGFTTLGPVTVTVRLPNPVYITGSTREWARVLIQALGEANKTIILASNVDLDIGEHNAIPIAQGVTVRGTRTARTLGPRVFTKTRPRNNLFNVTGDNVKIQGFRLHGPDFDSVDCDNCDIPYAIRINNNIGIQIANMELAGWSGGAIMVNEEGLERRIRRETAGAVWIHDNFFHHNLHHGQFGYGVDVGHGAYALIERNVFDFNRHAITAGGDAGTGYFARRNLILKGGTGEGACFGPFCVTTQEFDVHGTDNCIIPLPVDQGCGQAGEFFEMTENAFQYAIGYSIKVRGNPTIGAVVASNVFANSEGDAIAQNGNAGVGDGITNPIQRRGNVFGADSYGKYGVCDFDGDGKDDLFLATGVSWWYMSGANMHWVFLNSSTERLDQVGLGDFDGDHRCDVFSVHGSDFGIYKSGGAWHSLGTYPGVTMRELRFADFNGDGVMDIFRRDPNGQWWIVSPGYYGWTPIQSSSLALTQLRFGDFDGNGVADVIAVENGHWSVSWGGRQAWKPLNSAVSSSLSNVLIADLDGDGIDDIARYSSTGPLSGKWEVSWGGRSTWNTLANLAWPSTLQNMAPALNVRGYVGRFGGAVHKDLLTVDFTRLSQRLDRARNRFVPYGRYAY